MTSSPDAQIDAFVAATRKLNGQEICEREPWNTVASADAIRHFAYGTGDDNPLWLDAAYAAASYGRRVAPPAFLTSVCYPGLHGEPMDVPLTSLIGSLEFTWRAPVLENDRLRAVAQQTDVLDTEDRTGRRMVFVLSEVTYFRQPDEVVGQARCTMARPYQRGDALALDRPLSHYSDAERAEIAGYLTGYTRTGARLLRRDEIVPGQQLPLRVTPPLSIGDLVGWQAAIGPSYRAGVLGYRDGLRAPHVMITNPVTGWPVKYSQGHEDVHLAALRGMPAPFDNSVMRFASIAAIFTDWVGDGGLLRRLRIHTQAPVLYGDVTWYRSTIRDTLETEEGTVVQIEFTGTNQRGETTTTGEADVVLTALASPARSAHTTVETPVAIQGAHVPYPDVCAHTLFEQQAAETPDALAVAFGEERLTYRQLDRRASGIAAALQQEGVQRGTVVGVCAERSAAYVASLIGILKAGGAYLPLDPSHPPPRLATMLAEAGAELVLGQPSLRSLVPEPYAFMDLDSLWTALPEEPSAVTTDVRPEDRAYVLFTSGSTGVPKGVAVSHRSLSLYVRSIREPLGIRADDVYLHTASFSFSASVRQVFLPLTTGTALVVAGFEQRHDPKQLFALMRTHEVTVWDTVPTTLRYALSAFPEGLPPATVPETLRLVFTTGEPLSWELPRLWHRTWKQAAGVVNLYSQTETAGTVCYYRVPDEALDRSGFVPLGLPVENARLYLLDDELKPVQPGEVGELCVGGDRLADAYLQRQAPRDQRFVPDPFSETPGARLYRTGDLARLTEEGALAWAGRADRQVKIRGYRVQPAEVEGVVAAHPEVREAAVTVQTDAQGIPALAAYFVPRTAGAPDGPSLRGFVEGRLPSYMVPTAFVELDALPRTPSGKLDRLALPAPAAERRPAQAFVAPRTPTETAIAAIWADVLAVKQVGRHDNFFDLGGHSLHAVTVLNQVHQHLGVELPLRLLFDEPTVAQLAAAAEPEQPDDEIDDLLAQINELPEDEREAVLNAFLRKP